jgi:hypothetical protein
LVGVFEPDRRLVMPDVPASGIAAAAIDLLRETFEGPKGPSTNYLDGDPTAGYLPAIAALSAADASRPTRPGGATIAGHVHHVAFGLEVSEASLRGDKSPRDWSESWLIRSVDEPSWQALQRELRRRFDTLVATVEVSVENGGPDIGAVLGAIAHAAYHLGAVRQALTALGAGAGTAAATA